ncbi:MAG: hypothetical protein AAGJ10_10705 [Bacteroidota bacterium]
MQNLIRELIPHAPQMRLYVAPNIPENKLQNALGDYAPSLAADHVLALFDATLMGSAKDGILFTADGIRFQNNPMEAAQEVRYTDIVEVKTKRKLVGGQKVHLLVNRGRATMELQLDCSVKPEAAKYIARFLNEALLLGAAREMEGTLKLTAAGSNRQTVEKALRVLVEQGVLMEADLNAMLGALR